MKIALIVDNPYRDLPGSVLLAAYLCHYGATCYLVPFNLQFGEIWSLAPDFVLLNYLRTNNQEFVRRLMSAGIKAGVLDTEGGVLRDVDAYAETMAPDPTVRHGISHFFSWGPKLANHANEKEWYLDKQIAVTGNPRFDFYVHPWREGVLKVPSDADKLTKPLVLINGNFPLSNPCFKTPLQEVDVYVNLFDYDEKEVLRWQEADRKTMLEMTVLVNRLSSHFPEVTFVYRPHPFEKLETYTDLLDSRSNLHLVKQGTVDGWILRSTAVIQRNCSTAIEAGLARIPVLSPAWIPIYKAMETVEDVSLQCKTEADLINRLGAVLEGQQKIPVTIDAAFDEIITNWFYKIDGKAHQRIGDCILQSLSTNRSPIQSKHFRNVAYGTYRQNMSFSSKVASSIRKTFKLPVDYSFRNLLDRKNIQSDWEHSDKYFDFRQVSTMINAILNCSQHNSKKTQYKISVGPTNEHDYYLPYIQGKSVILSPKRMALDS